MWMLGSGNYCYENSLEHTKIALRIRVVSVEWMHEESVMNEWTILFSLNKMFSYLFMFEVGC